MMEDLDISESLESDKYTNSQSDLPSTNLLESKRQRKEIYFFHPQHSQSTTHCLSFCEKRKKFITVPIGPSIPRRDQEKNYA